MGRALGQSAQSTYREAVSFKRRLCNLPVFEGTHFVRSGSLMRRRLRLVPFGRWGPKQISGIAMRAEVEKTGAENALTRIHLGVSGKSPTLADAGLTK